MTGLPQLEAVALAETATPVSLYDRDMAEDRIVFERVEHRRMLRSEPEQGLDLDGESELLAIGRELSGFDLTLPRIYRRRHRRKDNVPTISCIHGAAPARKKVLKRLKAT
jgi:hypothetical protein